MDPHAEYYRASKAQERTNGRRSRSRRNSRISAAGWKLVDQFLGEIAEAHRARHSTGAGPSDADQKCRRDPAGDEPPDCGEHSPLDTSPPPEVVALGGAPQ